MMVSRHSLRAIDTVSDGRPHYAGSILCRRPVGAAGYAYCDFGEDVEDILAIQLLALFTDVADGVGFEIVLSLANPEIIDWDAVRLGQYTNLWRYPVSVGPHAAACPVPPRPRVVPAQGRYRYLIFWANPDSILPGDCPAHVLIMRRLVSGQKIIGATTVS